MYRSMKIKHRQLKKIPIFIGIVCVLLYGSIIYFNFPFIREGIELLDNWVYDWQVRHAHKPKLTPDNHIVVVDVDDRSLDVIGRWPWPRNVLGNLVDALLAKGASVIAMDFTFPEKEQNIVEELIRDFQGKNGSSSTVSALESVKGKYDYDAIFAKSLTQGKTILGIVFLPKGENEGVLPSPLTTLPANLSRSLLVPQLHSYLGNVEVLQKAATSGGFLNSSPSRDGVLRLSPLLLKHGDSLYTSLALEATRLFLKTKQTGLILQNYEFGTVLEGLQLDREIIPLTPEGQMLIPFRGKSYTFPFVSACDVLKGNTRFPFTGKLVFIGSSAAALGDLVPTSVAGIYPGVEVHASIASGIIDHFLPYRPAWGKGVAVGLILVAGLLCAILIPLLSAIWGTVFTLLMIFLLLVLNHVLWVDKHLVVPMVLPILIVVFLWGMDIVEGYFFETKWRQEIRQLFNQYVSPIYIDKILEQETAVTMTGEDKEVSVLFSDIRSFTTLSEQMSAPEVKTFLDRYFTAMTQVIFNAQGTIDKYIGDAIMAFWNAPLDDGKHAYHAVNAALKMQEALAQFNAEQKNPIRIGVGVNTGPAHVGDMGSQFRRNYTVLGDTVNTTSRLEGLTKHYHVGIVVGEPTYLQTKNEIIYRKLDKVRAKGKTIPVEIYQPLALQGQGSEALVKELEAHNQALDCYFQQKWDEARVLFKQLADKYPQNRLLYEEYLKRVQASPPGPGWDGAYTLETK